MSKNLIGDGLNVYPALRRFSIEHPDTEIDLLTLPDHTATLYRHMGIPVRVVTDEADLRLPYEKIFDFNPNTAFQLGDKFKLHIAACFAAMLEVKLEKEDWELKFDPPQVELSAREKGLFLISPFSRSCSSQGGGKPNKMLPWEKWKPLVRLLKSYGKIGVLGGAYDRAMELELAEDEYITGLPLEKVAAIIQAAKLVVTIDNGMAHLAASQKAKMILFYPACLGTHWIVPIGNPNMLQVIQLDPAEVDVALLVMAVKNTVQKHNIAGKL